MEIITIGEILVEMMAKEVGQSFSKTGELVGPFPSGAPAIFINQAAKVGSKCGIFSCVGKDDFGKINIDQLKMSGVETRHIKQMELQSTGVAFVTYHVNGNRDFIFHINNSAAAHLKAEDIKEEFFNECRYFHIMGSSMFNEEMMAATSKAVTICRSKGIKISFDPNIRKELLKDESRKKLLYEIFDVCDIFMPSESELMMFTDEPDEKQAVAKWLKNGKEMVIVKKGSQGASGYRSNEVFHLSPVSVEEVDPTGAGDCFGGTLISCLNQNMTFRESLEYANAAGALSVTKKGPMAGSSSFEELKSFIEQKGENNGISIHKKNADQR